MKFRVAVLSVIIAGGSTCFGQYKPNELKALDDALFLGNLTRKDLNFDRNPGALHYRIPFALECSSKPLEGIEQIMRIHGSATNTPARILRIALDLLGMAEKGKAVKVNSPELLAPDSIPPEYRAAFVELAQAITQANASIRAALQSLSMEERRQLLESLPRILDPQTTFDFTRLEAISAIAAETMLAKVDLHLIQESALDLLEVVEAAETKFKKLGQTSPYDGYSKFEVGRVVCVLGGSGPNIHEDRDASITVDLGGDDVYKGRHGAGVGYSSVLIDLEGDDRFLGPDLNFGAGILGVGIAIDSKGDDLMRGRSIRSGAGLGGIGIFIDRAGNDIGIGESLGFGSALFGVGIHIDASGSDSYMINRFGQGCGATAGFGWLIDKSGSDVYRTGDTGSSPQSRSNSQGTGTSWSPESAGGLGLLTDVAGSDHYLASLGCQSAGFSLGLGSLQDFIGDDVYVAQSESQGFGCQGGSGYFLDLAGSDSYSVTQSGGQGSSIDHGLAVWLDREGDDTYSSRAGRTESAIGGSLSLWIDSDGHDRYGFAPRSMSRFIGDSLSITLDLNGPDTYADGLDENTATLGASGIFIDYPTTGGSGQRVYMQRERPKAGTIPIGTASKMNHLYEEALQFGETSEGAIDQLCGMGMPAFEWMMVHRLPKLEHREIPLFLAIVENAGADARNRIGFAIGDKNDRIALGALSICFEGTILEGGPMISQALSRPALIPLAARAAGRLQALATGPDLMILCAGRDIGIVRDALTSLADMRDVSSVGTGQALLESTDLLIRRVAIRLVALSSPSTLASGRLFTRDPDERKARIGCELLALNGGADALKELGAALDDSRSGVRLQAAIGLAGRCPLDRWTAFMKVKQDPNPLVRMAAANLDPGR